GPYTVDAWPGIPGAQRHGTLTSCTLRSFQN
uniref:Uncharacterized protein n=1 Tax=Saimiri boliviensis boliviensis TaxID=39432 RepID=A0A2K6S8C7_SAIBB